MNSNPKNNTRINISYNKKEKVNINIDKKIKKLMI